MNEEVFGSVLSVLTFRTLEEAIERANNIPYGLSAGVWTDKVIFKMVNKPRAGVVWANTYNKVRPDEPVRRLQGKRLRSRGRIAGAGGVLSGGVNRGNISLLRFRSPRFYKFQSPTIALTAGGFGV